MSATLNINYDGFNNNYTTCLKCDSTAIDSSTCINRTMLNICNSCGYFWNQCESNSYINYPNQNKLHRDSPEQKFEQFKIQSYSFHSINPLDEAQDKKKLPRIARNVVRICSGCFTTKTSQWRRGENGIILCNACGLRNRRLVNFTKKNRNVSSTSTHARTSNQASDLKKMDINFIID